jgi:hypothetical protein
MYSAGVLLYYTKGDEKHFLLGSDSKYDCWSDFGGKVEYVDENNPILTASREFYEETGGVVFSKIHMNHLLRTSSHQLNCTSYKKRRYYMYLVECNVSEMSHITFSQFAIQQSLISNLDTHDISKFREKKEIQTFTLDYILSNEHMFRPVFFSSVFKNQDVIRRRVLI